MPNTITTKIREKYPQYQNLSEEELTIRIGERYPAYLKHEDFKSEFDTFKMRRDPPPSMRALTSVFPQVAPRAPVTEPTPFREERAPATFETRLPEVGTAERIEAVKSAEGAGLLEVAKVVKDIALSPMADIPPEVVAVTPLAQQVKTLFGEEAAAGVSEGLAGFASTITAPATIPALAVAGAGAVPSAVIGGLFALDAILNTPEKARQLAESIVKGDRREIARNLVESAGVAAQAVGGGAVVPRAFRRPTAKAAPPEKPVDLQEGAVKSEPPVIPKEEAAVPTEPPVIPETPTTVKQPTSPVGDQPLPDFLPQSETQFGEVFGVGRVPFFGRLFDPARGVDTPLGKATLGYFAERHGVGPAFSSRFGELIRGLEDPFEINKSTGDITNIGAPEGVSLKISDVFEALKRDPDAYELNAEQRAAFEKIQALERDFNELEARNQIGRSIDDEIGAFEEIVDTQQQPEAYFPRIVIDRPNPKRIGTGQSFGAKQFFEKSRLFETEQEGWSKGYRYEPSIEKRLVTRAERLYKRIADKRFSENSALVSKTRAELDAQLRHQYAEELASGEMTEVKLGQIGDSIAASGRVNVPAFQNKIFDIETAQFLEKALRNPTSEIRKMLVKLNNAGKTLFLGFDLGNFFIQLLPTFFSNPVKWGKSVVEGISAIGTSERFAAYVRDNQQAVRELAEHGSSVGRLPEFLAGFEEGELVTRIPVVGQVAKAFGRQFNTALDVAKTELWKAYREVTPRDQWTDTIRGIEAQLMSGRMESAGVSANRALTERAFFLAPSYYRGALDLTANLASKRVSGSIARRALGSYIAGGSALFYGIAQLLKERGDMTEEEIQERFNPAHPAFMMWKVKVDGNPVNVGFGGIHKSLVKLVANMYRTSVEHPENWKSLSPDQNPLVRWARGHAAPIPSIAFDQFTGRDFLGRDTDVTAVAPRLLPMAAQAAIPKEGEQAPTAFEPTATFFGLSVYPESMRRRVVAEQQKLAQEMFKKDYDQLNMRDQANIVKQIKANPEFNAPAPTVLMTQRAIKAGLDRTKRISKGVSDDNRKWLKEHSLEVRGYQPTVTIAGTEIPLTEGQREKYEALIIEEYNTSLDRIRDTKLAFPPDRLQRFLDERLEESRARAKTKLINQQP